MKQPKSVQIFDQINSDLDVALKSIPQKGTESNKYLLFCIRDLSYIANSVIDSVAKNLHDKYKIYTAGTMTRLLMEIIATIVYLKSHSDQAEGYWRNQEEMQKKMQNKVSSEDRWKLYMRGDLNHIGRLEDETAKRIKNSLGKEEFGQYTFLNFYSHPNIAGYKHILVDSTKPPGVIVRFTASIFYANVNRLIHELSTVDEIVINRDGLLKKVDVAHKAYFLEVGLL